MGSGQSTENVQSHLQRWEEALSELERISATNSRLLEQDRLHSMHHNAADTSRAGDREDENLDRSMRGGRRQSSMISFNDNNGANTNIEAAGISISSLPGPNTRMRSSQTTPESRPMDPRTMISTNGHSNNDGTTRSSASGVPAKHSRKQVIEIRRARVELFRSYLFSGPAPAANCMECSHFGAAAVALSYLLGGAKNCKTRSCRVTVEDIFFAAQVPLYMLHTGAPHLPVMADILREFVDVDNRFKSVYSIEAFHLDISPTVGQVDLGPNEVGDRQTRMSLPEFRRVITHDCEEETQVIRLVNFDPYVLEQEMLVDAYDDDYDKVNSPLAASVLGKPLLQQRHSSPINDGSYAVIVDVRNAVQLMVTIAEGVVNDSLHVSLTEVPAAALFKAMMTAEEGHRARGFIRIFKKDIVPEFTTDEIPQFWTPELCSGKVLGTTLAGVSASVISNHISPHIVGVAWALHLLGGVRDGTHGYGNGLPISHIIRTMRFPTELFLDGTLALGQVFEYAKEYLRRVGCGYTVHLYPVLTKISRQDAVPTISVFDLESILIDVQNANGDPEGPEHVMVIMYNASVAHNVLYIVDAPQWCVLAGYDSSSQTALLLDAHPKIFSRTWSCPLDRLHKAMTGSGYIMFSKSDGGGGGASSSQRARSTDPSPNTSTTMPNNSAAQEVLVGAPKTMAPMVQARLQLLQQQDALRARWLTEPVVKTFTYPSLPVMPTIVALACSKLGALTTVEDVIQQLPFEISSLIIRSFTLESLHVCLTMLLYHRKLDNEIRVSVHHGECDADGNQQLTEEQFRALLMTAHESADHVLILHFDANRLLINGVDHPYGHLGIVVNFDPKVSSVLVSDCNPQSHLRNWAVSVSQLYEAITDTEATQKHRMRGCLLLSRGPRAVERFPEAHTRDFRLELLPVQNVFHVSPSPHFQGMSFAFSQLGYFCSPEEIFYEAYLKTVDDQRRRGSQAFAWRDVDVSLSVINTEISAAFMAQVCQRFLKSRNPRITVPSDAAPPSPGAADADEHAEDSAAVFFLSVEVVDEIDLEEELDQLLKTATQSTDMVLLLNYNAVEAHRLRGLSRSVALIKSYDPERQLVELWDAEYAVFGLSWTVTVAKLIVLGDLENEGQSPFGFVRFTRHSKPPASPPRRRLMSAPLSAEEEAAQEAMIAGRQRANKEQ